MRQHVSRQPYILGAALAAAIVVVAARPVLAQQETTFEQTSMLTYTKGQPVIPAYEGWHPNADGSIDLWFGYLNQNYWEEPDVPVGANNTVSAPSTT